MGSLGLKNLKVLVMVSGGPDSVYLLRCFVAWRESHGVHFEVLHVNHHLRGHESGAESRFVRALSRKHGIVFHLKDFHFEQKAGNLQDLARRARIKFAFEVARKRHLNAVATAHHADDAFETLCMRASRGAGLSGLCGIRSRMKRTENDQTLLWLRPLLGVSKTWILKDLKRLGQTSRVDSSNLSLKYFRNRVRSSRAKNVTEVRRMRFLNLSETLQEIDAWFELRQRQLWHMHGKSVPEESWKTWPAELKFRYFAHAMRDSGFVRQIEKKHFELIQNRQRKLVLGSACSEWLGKRIGHGTLQFSVV